MKFSKVIAFSLLGAFAAPVTASACTQPGNAAALRSDVAQRVNAERRKAGLGALSASSTLQKAAQSLACDNAAQGQWSHTGRNGSDLTARLRQAGYRFRTANENVGRFRGPESAVKWWMGSPSHRPNILSEAIREIGVGVALGADGRAYWVTVKGAPR